LDLEKEIEPLPELMDDERPRRYRKTMTKEYLAVLYCSSRGSPEGNEPWTR
jgi:hypothetical protein